MTSLAYGCVSTVWSALLCCHAYGGLAFDMVFGLSDILPLRPFAVHLIVELRKILQKKLKCELVLLKQRRTRIPRGEPWWWGFDAIAMLAAMAALKEASQQEPSANLWSERFPTEDCAPFPNCAVRCKVLDLAPAWTIALSAVSDVASEIWPWQSADFIELIAPSDLRDSMATSAVEEVGQADMVIAAYVLHENEAALLVEGLLGGVIPDVFRAAPVGVPLIFLDATHRLWPALVETARASCSSSLSEERHDVDAMPFTVIVPEDLASYIHAGVLIKDETPRTLETLSALSVFELFKSHQKANEMRLKRLSELQKA